MSTFFPDWSSWKPSFFTFNNKKCFLFYFYWPDRSVKRSNPINGDWMTLLFVSIQTHPQVLFHFPVGIGLSLQFNVCRDLGPEKLWFAQQHVGGWVTDSTLVSITDLFSVEWGLYFLKQIGDYILCHIFWQLMWREDGILETGTLLENPEIDSHSIQ